MKSILIFAGTTEGRRLSECLSASGIAHTLCVATEYGEIVLKGHPLMSVRRGRMDEGQIKEFIKDGSFVAVVDATHPYAEIVTGNIQAAMRGTDIPYFRLKREIDASKKEGNVTYFETHEECAKALGEIQGNILFAIGIKELSKYCAFGGLRDRLFVRVLPCPESLSVCAEYGIKGRQVIAMQGPFTAEMNEATIRQFGISCLVTKQSGASGGYFEKIESAGKTGIPVFSVGSPKKDEGRSFYGVCSELEKICQRKIHMEGRLEITLAGAGMGNKNSLTKEASEKIKTADILLGAERMTASYVPRLEKKPFYSEGQVIPYLHEVCAKYPMENLKVAVLFSGDSGFYSGCQALYNALQEEINAGRLYAEVRIMPGISSVACLAACIGESYHDAAVLSMHGKELHNIARRIMAEKKVFMLMSGVGDVNRLGEILTEAGMDECEIITGYQLSYEGQQIKKRTPVECMRLNEEGLYTCFIRNPNAANKNLTHGTADSEFIRDKVPMTKEEVRDISICKLKLCQNSVLFDIGSGTGSIAIEAAGLSPDIHVYAIERDKEALSLIYQNMEKFRLDNVTVIGETAPDGLRGLPKASHAFIGGSGGKFKEILQFLYEMNPAMRVVINAVSMETLCEIREMLSLYPIADEEVVQMQVSRAEKAGRHHIMRAENPVWICAFDFCERWDKYET